MKTRKNASIVNSISAVGSQFLSMILLFVSRTVFIRVLSEQYLGLNGLFTNLLSVLSFSELGIGTAIVASMYQPLSENNIGQVKALMQLYKRCYFVIAGILTVSGLILALFLPYLIAGEYQTGNIYVAFGLYLMNSVMTYIWSYKRSILIANQEGYIDSLNQLIFNVLTQLFQIFCLYLYQSYYIYLLIQLLFTVLSNTQISRLANRRFNYLREPVTEPVDRKTLRYLKRNVVGMVSSKIGEVVVYGTDNILLASFVGLTAVGKYSNYTLIINGINSVLAQGLNAITASVGNLKVNGSKERQAQIYFQYFQIVSYVSFLASILMALFFPAFISFWVGERFVLPPVVSYLIVMSFYISSLRYANLTFMNAYGTYWEMRHKSIVEALVNFIVSFFLIKLTAMTISAVVVGTLIANIAVNSWWEPLIVFRSALKLEITKYVRLYIVSVFFGTTLIALAQLISSKIEFGLIASAFVTLWISVLLVTIYHFVTVLIGFSKNEKPLKVYDIVVAIRKKF